MRFTNKTKDGSKEPEVCDLQIMRVLEAREGVEFHTTHTLHNISHISTSHEGINQFEHGLIQTVTATKVTRGKVQSGLLLYK